MNGKEYQKLKETPDVVFISFEWWAGRCNMGFWTADMNNEIVDYHTKEELIKQAEKMGKEWMVLTHHKGKRRGEVSIAMRGGKK